MLITLEWRRMKSQSFTSAFMLKTIFVRRFVTAKRLNLEERNASYCLNFALHSAYPFDCEVDWSDEGVQPFVDCCFVQNPRCGLDWALVVPCPSEEILAWVWPTVWTDAPLILMMGRRWGVEILTAGTWHARTHAHSKKCPKGQYLVAVQYYQRLTSHKSNSLLLQISSSFRWLLMMMKNGLMSPWGEARTTNNGLNKSSLCPNKRCP